MSEYIKNLSPEEYVSQTIRERLHNFQKENYPNGHMTGLKHSKETKRKIGEGNKGKIVSEKTRQLQSKIHKQRYKEHPEMFQKGLDGLRKYEKEHINYWYGKKLPKEMIDKSVKTRKKIYKERGCFMSKEEREKRSEKWSGKNNPRYGKKPTHNKTIKYKDIEFRSSWEIIVAKFLDNNNIKWEYEPEVFEIGEKYTYTPDFYLPKYNLYIEVKGYFRNEIMKYKFEEFSKKYPIILLMKKEINNTELILECINENKIYKVCG